VTEAGFARPHLQPVPVAALALAMLLHIGTGAAFWWTSPDRPPDIADRPIMLTFDSEPSNAGLRQPERPGPPAESLASATTRASTMAGRQEALAKPEERPAQASLPVFEFSIPPVMEPPPVPTSREFLQSARPPPRTARRVAAVPPPSAASRRPPAERPATMRSPVHGPVPGDVQPGRGRQRNDYLSLLFQHLAPYRADPAGGTRPRGRVVTRVTLARDGRVLDVHIAGSSGSAALDAAEVAAIRKGSPFPALPAAMPGDPVILVLPITY